MSVQHVLKRTMSEKLVYDPEKIKAKFSIEWYNYKTNINNVREGQSRPTLADETLWEYFVIELFSLYEGSQFGANLFYQISYDEGCELFTEDDQT